MEDGRKKRAGMEVCVCVWLLFIGGFHCLVRVALETR